MKLSFTFFIAIFFLGGVFDTNAQDPGTTLPVASNYNHPAGKADTTSMFRDKSLQFYMPKRKEFRTWEVGINLGTFFSTTDIAASDVNQGYAKQNFGYGLKVTKFFTHSFGLQVQFLQGKLSGQNHEVDTYGYTTTLKYDLTLNAVLHIGNIRFLSRNPNIGIYGAIGVGVINFTPKNDSAGVELPYNIYVPNYNGPHQQADYSNTTEYVIPFTAGIRYLVSNKISLSLEYSLRATRSDKLDGWWRVLSEDDNYTYASLGATFHLGKQKDIIEFTNPVDILYTRLNTVIGNIRSELDSLETDSDSDRVSNFWDRDPVTPIGYKVYGDGTPVDFDGDGVPDAVDFCPTVAGPVANHGCPEQKVEVIEPKKQAVEPIKPEITKAEEEIIAEVFKNLQFETGKSIIRQSSFVSLNELVNLLKRKPNYKLLIEGHTDNVGGAAANMKLSTDRAEAVKKYIADKGVDAGRLTAVGYGLTRPVADNKTPEGRQQNRRVDFTIVQ